MKKQRMTNWKFAAVITLFLIATILVSACGPASQSRATGTPAAFPGVTIVAIEPGTPASGARAPAVVAIEAAATPSEVTLWTWVHVEPSVKLVQKPDGQVVLLWGEEVGRVNWYGWNRDKLEQATSDLPARYEIEFLFGDKPILDCMVGFHNEVDPQDWPPLNQEDIAHSMCVEVDWGEPEPVVQPTPGATPGTPDGTYVVQKGDYLVKISRLLFNNDPQYWDEIADLNGLQPPWTIYPGDVLEIP